jgi:hypothetical protein
MISKLSSMKHRCRRELAAQPGSVFNLTSKPYWRLARLPHGQLRGELKPALLTPADWLAFENPANIAAVINGSQRIQHLEFNSLVYGKRFAPCGMGDRVGM